MVADLAFETFLISGENEPLLPSIYIRFLVVSCSRVFLVSYVCFLCHENVPLFRAFSRIVQSSPLYCTYTFNFCSIHPATELKMFPVIATRVRYITFFFFPGTQIRQSHRVEKIFSSKRKTEVATKRK